MTIEEVFGTRDYFQDPGGWLAPLRESAPVHQVTIPGMPPAFLVTRYDEARRIFTDSRLCKDRTRLTPDERGLGPEDVWVSGRQLLSTDQEDHSRMRRLLAGWWSRAAAEQWPALIEHHTRDLLDAMAAGPADTDLVTSFARPLPMRVLADVVGIPQSQVPVLLPLLHTLTTTAAPNSPELVEAHAGLSGIWFRLAREHAGDDTLLGVLSRARRQRDISMVELNSLLTMLLIAGAHSMSMFLPRTVMLLADEPALTATLAGSDAPAQEAVVEELIRLCAPFPMASHRYATREMELWGMPVPAGSLVVPAVAAANRDPRVYDDPESACPGRRSTEPRPLTFGHGVHYCLGATLARQEALIALTHLYQRFPSLTPTSPATWRNHFIPEPTALPVRLH
ncbi:cytochrome P450 [Actinoplanes sp. NPDC051851]|uniref:cytochrome P450 n=1 Tax=Actinoplanes sp. NPDC051851 TaxID=3154753 RepID=UPI00344A2A7C